MHRAPSPDEEAARLVYEHHRGEQLTFNDPGPGSAADWRCDRCGRLIEVSRLTDPKLKAAYKAFGENALWPIPGPESWWLTFHGHPDYAKLRATLPSLLEAIDEQHFASHEGFDEVDLQMAAYRSDFWVSPDPVLRRLADIGVLVVRRFIGTNHPAIHISPTGGGAAGPPNDTLTEVEAWVSSKDDNRRKLIVADDAHHRSLFVWIDHATSFSIAFNVTDGELPTRAPDWATWLGDFWIVHDGFGRGWHWSDESGWSSVELDPPHQP